jgi:RimJ/RimL family protein N-acetyltransferase
VIEGRRVRLRPVEEEDIPTIHRWMNQADVWFALDLERPTSLDEVRAEVGRARSDGHPFVVELDGRPVGRIDVHDIRGRDRICSLRLVAGEPGDWEADAVAALAGYAFDRLDLRRVEVRTVAANARLIDACEASGFTRDAVLPERSWQDGRWLDHVILSVTREGFTGVSAS